MGECLYHLLLVKFLLLASLPSRYPNPHVSTSLTESLYLCVCWPFHSLAPDFKYLFFDTHLYSFPPVSFLLPTDFYLCYWHIGVHLWNPLKPSSSTTSPTANPSGRSPLSQLSTFRHPVPSRLPCPPVRRSIGQIVTDQTSSTVPVTVTDNILQMGLWEKMCSPCHRETLEISCQESHSSSESPEPMENVTLNSNEASTMLNPAVAMKSPDEKLQVSLKDINHHNNSNSKSNHVHEPSPALPASLPSTPNVISPARSVYIHSWISCLSSICCLPLSLSPSFTLSFFHYIHSTYLSLPSRKLALMIEQLVTLSLY